MKITMTESDMLSIFKDYDIGYESELIKIALNAFEFTVIAKDVIKDTNRLKDIYELESKEEIITYAKFLRKEITIANETIYIVGMLEDNIE